MHPEIKQQLYGGEITDYIAKPKLDEIDKENKNIAEIYNSCVKNKNSILDLLRLDPSKNLNNKLK